MVDFIRCLTNLLFFDIPLLYYTNLSGDIYLSFGTFISLSSVFECNFFEAF